jgi:hypothetical protein
MFKTKIAVDWYSFTLLAYPEYFDPNGVFPEYATIALETGLGSLWSFIVSHKDDWQAAKSRPPYTTAIQRENMFYLYAGSSQSHILLECSGKGCQELEKNGLLQKLISETSDRATRIDIAHDWKTAIRPMQVHDDGFSSKFKSVTTITSPTGETFYLGSPKSEKRVRVYVYDAPHPRAGILRFEYIFRKTSAKIIAKRLETETLEDVVSSCIVTYGWKSEFLKQERTTGLANIRPERGSAKTLRWILTQVAPAMRRLIDESVIEDPELFFKNNFMP